MKKPIDVLIWAVLLFLITPSTMVLASWNAVPGDTAYTWKLSLEQICLKVLSPSDKLQSTTQVKIAERRYGEVAQVLSSEYAVESLNNLNTQLSVTTSGIQEISKTITRDEVTERYITSLKEMSVSLDEQKTKVQTGEIVSVAQAINTPTSVPIVNAATPTPAPTQTPAENEEEVVQKIEEVQDKIDEDIEGLENDQRKGQNRRSDIGKR